MYDSQTLENAVMSGSPQEVAKISKSLDRNNRNSYANRALGLACRFGGLEYVRAIVENDKTINDANKVSANYWLALLDIKHELYEKRVLVKHGLLKKTELEKDILPVEERAEIVKYLCEHGKDVLFNKNDLLYHSVICHNRELTAVLKENGASFTRWNRMAFAHPMFGIEWAHLFLYWNNFESREMIEILEDITAETGSLSTDFVQRFYEFCDRHFLYPGFLKFILGHCSRNRLDKSRFLKGAIDRNSTAHLEMFAENGWLSRLDTCDGMIAYAAEAGKQECSAWLLDYKNRSFDLEAERIKAEKKALRELNADPNSVTELKKLWSFKPREDGTLIITGYKGKLASVAVPSRIGRNTVTAIGKAAFSPNAPGLRHEQHRNRMKISRVALPDSLRSIEEYAFCLCGELTEISIPKGVEKIGDVAFGACRKLTRVDIPDTVKSIGANAFYDTGNLTAIVEPNSYAEKFCKEHGIRFEYKEQ